MLPVADESATPIALDHWTLIRADGPDAQDFLHRQLTADIAALAPQTSTLAGYCMPDGRLIATTFVFWRDQALHLALPASVAPAVLRRLRLFVLRDRVTLSTCDLPIAGRLDNETPAAGRCVTDGGITWIGLPGDRPRALAIGATGGETSGSESWTAGEIDAGLPMVVAETAGLFLPQSLRLDTLGGVSFRKGCYPGQEVVARLHYRGKLKRVLVRADRRGGPCHAGDVIQGPDQALGHIAATTETAARAVVQLTALGMSGIAGQAQLTLKTQALQTAEAT